MSSRRRKDLEIVSEDVKLDTSDAKMKCKPEYLEMLWRTPVLSRNVCIAGHLHHGKSSLVDALMPRRRTMFQMGSMMIIWVRVLRNCHKTILTRYDYTQTRD